MTNSPEMSVKMSMNARTSFGSVGRPGFGSRATPTAATVGNPQLAADAASGVKVATQSATSAPKVSKIGRRAVDFVLGRRISGSSLQWPASFIREEPSGPGNIPEDVDLSLLAAVLPLPPEGDPK